MVHTAERFLDQLKLQDQINKFANSQFDGLGLQPLVGKDFFSELQKQNDIDRRIAKDMDMNLSSDQIHNIKNLKYLQGLKRKSQMQTHKKFNSDLINQITE